MAGTDPDGVVTIGLMSGTSLDGLDGVLVRWKAAVPSSPAAPSAQAPFEILARAHCPFPEAFRSTLLDLNRSGTDELHRAALAANRHSMIAADVVRNLLERSGMGARHVRAIGLHGQTVRHRPGEFDGMGYTLQLHNAALLAEWTRIDVVCDFRSRDVAAGGQGAPLVPAFHADIWSQPGQDVAVLNLGGIANLTLIDAAGRVLGFDCGPANVLMDLWTARHHGHAYDAGGAWAAQGHVLPELLASMQAEPFFRRPIPKSTGRDLFHEEWLERHAVQAAAPQDVQATLCELTAWAVDDHLAREMPTASAIRVCGGGALNVELMRRLAQRLQARVGEAARVEPTSAHGLDVMDVEAAAFAWLAWRFIEGRPGNLPRVTGARGPRILGALYPGGGSDRE